MMRGLISFAVGIYAGIYISQNYDVPKMDDPSSLFKKLKEYAEQYKKDN